VTQLALYGANIYHLEFNRNSTQLKSDLTGTAWTNTRMDIIIIIITIIIIHLYSAVASEALAVCKIKYASFKPRFKYRESVHGAVEHPIISVTE